MPERPEARRPSSVCWMQRPRVATTPGCCARYWSAKARWPTWFARRAGCGTVRAARRRSNNASPAQRACVHVLQAPAPGRVTLNRTTQEKHMKKLKLFAAVAFAALLGAPAFADQGRVDEIADVLKGMNHVPSDA